MKLKDCNLCPLRSEMNEYFFPCQPITSKSDLMIIAYQPPEDAVTIGIEATIDYDLIKSVVKTSFYFTYLVKCLGKTNSKIIKTCMKNWVSREIQSLKPKTIITMGKEVSDKVIPGINKKKSIREIAGERYIIDGTTYIPTFSSAFILNGGKSTLNSFKNIFEKEGPQSAARSE